MITAPLPVRAEQQVALPVPGHRPVGGLGRRAEIRMSSVIPSVTRFAPPVWALRLVRWVRRCAVSSP